MRGCARPGGPTLGEALAVWGLFVFDAAVMAVRHRRRGDRNPGPALTRFIAHPWAPVALPLAGMALARLGRERARPSARRVLSVPMLAATAGLLIGRWDAGGHLARGERLPALVVAFAAGLTLQAADGRQGLRFAAATAADVPRLVLGGALLLVALPWLLAEAGVYASDVPLVQRLYLARHLPGRPGLAAVHLGHHHGLDGALLAWAALALSRQLPNLSPGSDADALSLTLAALLVYGLARAAEDAWLEQVVKRGWSERRLPPLVVRGRPVGPRAWLVVAVLTLALHGRWRPAVSSRGVQHTLRTGPPRMLTM